jgi:hypothetical protein
MKNYVSSTGLKFNKQHIVNPSDYDPGNGTKAFIIYNECGTICLVFAKGLQDALEIAVDEERFECQRIECSKEEEEYYTRLGNYGDLYDLTHVGFEIVDTPFTVAQQ